MVTITYDNMGRVLVAAGMFMVAVAVSLAIVESWLDERKRRKQEHREWLARCDVEGHIVPLHPWPDPPND